MIFEFNNNDLIYPVEILTNKSRPYPAFKILGVWLDENLSFDYHVPVTSKKVSKTLYSLKKVRNILSTKSLKSLYYALIHPYFLYCLPVYSSTSSKNLNLLLQLQKRCIRISAGAKYMRILIRYFIFLIFFPYQS